MIMIAIDIIYIRIYTQAKIERDLNCMSDGNLMAKTKFRNPRYEVTRDANAKTRKKHTK